MKQLSHQHIAYALLRITMGVNFLAHGLVRFPQLVDFRTWMLAEFKDSMIPAVMTYAFASILPFVEFSLGILLLLGLFTRHTLVAMGVLMIMLILGSCLIEKWEFVGFQMIYALFIFVLLYLLKHNHFSIDFKLKK
jgi:thiosulfate dehydrogenase [quinone] large subunit